MTASRTAFRTAPVVLLVDENEADRLSYGRILRDAGMTVQEVGTGGDVLALSADVPDLVLLGAGLTEPSGRDVCRLLKADPVTAAIPVLQMAAHPLTADERLEGAEGAADDYLAGPLSPAELLARVRAWLRVRQASERFVRRQALGADEAWLERRVHERTAALIADQEALQASERRFRTIVEQGHDAVTIVAPDGTVAYASPTIVRIGGRTPAEVVGRGALEWTHPDDLADLTGRFQKFLDHPGESVTVRQRYLHKDGAWRWVEATCTNLLAEPAVQGVVCRFHDATDQRQAEEVHARLAAIVESTEDAILSVDPGGTVQTWNAGAERLFGYTAAEIVGRHVEVLIPQDGRDLVRERIECAARGEPVPTCETRRLCKDGRLVAVAVTISPLRRPDGEVAGMCAVYRDVSQRKQVEDEVRGWKERYEAAVRATGQILYDWDPASNLVEWGGSYEQALGYSAEEMPRQMQDVARFLLHPEDREAFRRETERVTAAGTPFDLRYRVRRRNGAYIIVHDRGHFLQNAAGQGTRMVGFLVDITEQVRLEAQLRQAQKMEAIGRLAGGVAHDFNNLLTVINGYSELVLETVDRDDPAVRPLVAEIHQAGTRAAALTGQLLAFSRQQIVQPRPVDLNGLVSDLQRMLSRVIGEDIELTTTLRPGLERVSADPAQLEQVILNLAVNARDAMPQGGRLTLQTENVVLEDGFAEDLSSDFSEVPPGPYVRLSVSDTGRGMTAETLTHLFEPFFTTKESGQGTGLGLAMVYGIVRQSGGHVRVRSALERGSTFEIHLPALPRQTDPADGPADRPQPPRGSETILLVEDEDGVRAVAARMLRQLGYNVLAAADGPQALTLFQRQPDPVDLLLTDVVMPGMNGRQVAERIRAARPDVKILYMSGYTDDAVLRHGISESEAAFVQKPFSIAMLARRVRETLDAPVPA